jgi:Flp pilus assembly protein TadD
MMHGGRRRWFLMGAMVGVVGGGPSVFAQATAPVESASTAFDRAVQQNSREDFRGALESLLYLRVAEPDNPKIAAELGNAYLGLNRKVTARREYNRALVGDTTLANAYLGRALAESRLGDAIRTERDYARALAGGAPAKNYRKEIDESLAQRKITEPTEDLLAAVEKSVGENAPAATVQTQALRLQRAMAARRKRYDDWYQGRLMGLEDAIRAKPKSTAALVDLARFLCDEAQQNRRGEKVEPRRSLVTYRPLANDYAELHRAIRVADLALALDSRLVCALMVKAGALYRLGDRLNAQAIVEQTIAIAPRDPDALRMRADYWQNLGASVSIQASSLRMPSMESSSHTENRSDGVYEVTTTTIHAVSENALAQARAYDAAADRLYDQADEATKTVFKIMRGTVAGYLYESSVALDLNNAETGLLAINAALKLDPESVRAHQALVEYYRRTREPDRSELEQSVTANLFETTAGWLLHLTWTEIDRRRFDLAERVLAQARLVDPVDARVPAYLAVVRETQGRGPEARALFQTALALEEARLQLDEPLHALNPPVPRDPLDFGLAMKVREHLAGYAQRSNDLPGALALYQANIACAAQISRSALATEMFSAMLPDPTAEKYPIPAPVAVTRLLADAHAGAAKVLQSLGRNEEARNELRAAAGYGYRENIARPGPPGPRPGPPSSSSDVGPLRVRK